MGKRPRAAGGFAELRSGKGLPTAGRMSEKSNGFREEEREALALLQQGRLVESEAIYRKIVKAGVRRHTIYGNLAAICGLQGGRTEEMVALLREAIAIQPSYAAGFSNLGNALLDQGDPQAAIECYRKAVAIKPDFPGAFFNLGNVLRDQGDAEAAIAAYRQALAVKPDYAEALSGLGSSLHDQGNLPAAIDAHQQALAINPHYPQALTNLANALKDIGDVQAAIACYNKALSFEAADTGNSNWANPRFNLALALLLSGDYENGWKEYRWRFLAKDVNKPAANPPIAQWNGSNLAPGEPLALVSEQGLGDTLQFMRYVICLNNNGIPADLYVPPKLHDLIRVSGITTRLHSPEEANGLTSGKWLPLLSLPGLLKVSAGNPVVTQPYIKVPQEKIAQWKEKLAAEQNPVIGINWEGSSSGKSVGRSIPLESFSLVIKNTSANLLSLQKGDGSEQLADCTFRERFVACQEEISHTWDFVETAAMIANCDLVITSDTAVGHLAAGMGCPTWLLLAKVPHWPWGITGSTTFWYPSMRLFRQQERGNWHTVMEEVVAALRHREHGGT